MTDYDLLVENEFRPPEEQNAQSARGLGAMLRFAAREVPYYRNRVPYSEADALHDDPMSALAALPVLSKLDVMDAGRMAVIADPTGAVLAFWEAKAHIGCGVVNEHGTLTWTELMTPDPAKAAAFYETVLGWTTQTVPMPSGEYTVFHVAGGNEQGIAGAMAPPMPGVPLEPVRSLRDIRGNAHTVTLVPRRRRARTCEW